MDIFNGVHNCRYIAVYRPPSSNTDIAGIRYCTLLSKCIEHLYPRNSTTILCGDFNMASLNNSDDYTCSGIL